MMLGILSRDDLESREDAFLAPYACHAAATQGRAFPENPSPNRTCFQQDRDRLIHSTAFRRLKHKTQVFIAVEGDHYRTRLTHTLEVVQMARHLTRLLALNEDLAECIALAHDLGHPPFGHAGEVVLAQKMKDQGGFEHNLQSKRIVEVLETRYPGFTGLNLSFELRHGLMKHGGGRTDHPQSEANPQISLEAQLVDLADEIAYTNHDFDDGLRAGLLHLPDLEKLALWQLASEKVRRTYHNLEPKTLIHLCIGHMIKALITDVTETTFKNIQLHSITNIQNVYRTPSLAAFSTDIRDPFHECKKFLMKNFYQHPSVTANNLAKQQLLAKLFDNYLKVAPADTNNSGQHRIVCDYVSGMTDTFAERCYQETR